MADHLAAPTPLEEHRRLAAFAGERVGDETIFPSRHVGGGKKSFVTRGVFTCDRDDRLHKSFRQHPSVTTPPSPACGVYRRVH